MTSKSTISSSTKLTHVTLLGKDIGKLLKTLVATTESSTRVVTENGSIKTSGRTSNFLATKSYKQ